MTIIQHTMLLYQRCSLSYRDVQELLHQRGIQAGIVVNGRPSWAGRTRFSTPASMRTPLLHKTLREWNIKFGSLFAEDLRHREPRRGSRWHLDEVCTSVDGVRHWLWRAVDEHGFVLDILLQRHRDTEATKTLGSFWVSGSWGQKQGEQRAEERLTALPNIVHGLKEADVERQKAL